jgi:drug/metabolite transporter (DMT)-like permease
VIAVVGGLGAAFAWATATICAARATRLIGAPSVLAWVMLTGLAVTLPWAVIQGRPELDSSAARWLAVSGVGNCAGLLLAYSGLKIGKVGIVAPIVSTEGAIAALIAVAAGEQLASGTGGALAVVALGTVLAGATGDSSSSRGHDRAAALFAATAALSFGASLYATGQIGTELPLVWAVIPPRVVGVVAIALPLALMRRLVLTRAALPFVLASGLAEVAGFASFALGARHGIAISAVLASQFGAVAAVAAFVLFGERLGRPQVAGVAAIAAGVAVLTALQA